MLDWHNIKRTFPIPAGGVHPRIVTKILNDLGYDCVISAGGAIHGHPKGAIAGAKALRQAIDAFVSGVGLEEYSANHEELASALEKWK